MKIMLIVAIPFFFACEIRAQAPDTSIIELIANPDKFDGKVVRIIGVINIDFESNAIYLTKEHWANSVTTNGVWLTIDKNLADKRKWGNGRYFLVEGVFHAEDKGHMGLWRGAISDIAVMELHEIISKGENADSER